jgi:hypothetical protein
MTDIPADGPTVSIIFSNPPVRVNVSVSAVSDTPPGDPGPTLEVGTAKFLSAANRSYFADLPRNDRIITDVPATYSILPTLDGALFSIGPDNELVMPATGANGKRLVVRATHADGSKTDQLVTYYEQPAPAHPCLAMMYIAAWETFEGVSHTTFNAANADIWGIFGIYPDATGNLITSYFHRDSNGVEQTTQGAAWAKGVADRVNAAGKKAVVTLGGAGTWPNIRVALADDTKRAKLATDLLAEVDRLGVHGVDIDLESNAGEFTDQEFLWQLDLIKRLRNARPSLILSFPTYGQIIQGVTPDQVGGCPDIVPAIISHANMALPMSYSCSPADQSWTSWLSDPLYGAAPGHPISVGTAIDFFLAMKVPSEALLLPSATFYSMFGPDITKPGQSLSGKNATVPDQTGMYLHLLTGGKFAPSGFVDHYDARNKDNYRTLPTAVEGFSYFANETEQTWADKREACKGNNHWTTPQKTVRFRGSGCWRYGHGAEQIVPKWYAALTTDTIPASVDPPAFGGGTQVALYNFATSTLPSNLVGYALVPYWASTNDFLSVANGALVVAGRSDRKWVGAQFTFANLTVGNDYTISAKAVEALPGSSISVYTDDGGGGEIASTHFSAAGDIGITFTATATQMRVGFWTGAEIGTIKLDDVRLGAL